jgi:hypothetical protein
MRADARAVPDAGTRLDDLPLEYGSRHGAVAGVPGKRR